MVRQIAPVFFTMDIPATLAYYTGKLGFACLGTWQDPPVYAIVASDQQVIHFRCAAPPTANSHKYADELLRVSGFVLTNPEQTSLPLRGRSRRTLCRVCRPRRRIHSASASLHPMLAMLSLLAWPHSPFGNWTRKPRPACGFAPPTTDARWKKKRVRSCAPL